MTSLARMPEPLCFEGCEREAGALHAADGPDEEPPEREAQPEVGVDDSHPHHH